MDDQREDRRKADREDTHTAIQLVELRGEIKGQGTVNEVRFGQIDMAIADARQAIHDVRKDLNERVDKHEEEEKPYWAKLDTVRRLQWMGMAILIMLGAFTPYLLSVMGEILKLQQTQISRTK